MKPKDRNFLVVCAVRYCLGRQSYIVGTMCDYLRKNAAKIHPADRAVIIRDIDDQDDYGQAYDKDEWMRARAALAGVK